MNDPAPSRAGHSATGSGVTSVSLLHKVQARDPDAWARLVRLYSPLVYHWCRKAGLNAEDAADVLQDVFLAVATRVVDFRRDAIGDSFRGWLRGICRYKVADHYRGAYAEPAAAGGSTAYQSLVQVADPEDAPALDGDDDADRGRVLRSALEMVRGDFAPATWSAFWEYVMNGRPATDVAKDLGLRLDSVYQAKARVLRRLRDEFEGLVEQ